VLSLPHVNIVQDGMLNPKMRFDPRTFQWIGRLREQFQVGVVSKKSGVNSIAGAKSKALIAGATAANSPTALNPRILNLLAGTKFKIVSGYRGTDEIAIAWERGEVDVLTTGWDNIVRRYGDRLKAGLIHPIYVYGTRRVSELGQVPVISEFGRTADETAFLRIYTIGTEIGRALAAPPNVPKERIQMWRMAFEKMLGDPDFQKTTRQGEVWINSLKGEELAAKVADVTALPSEQVTKARQFYDQLQATGR